jgi:hypothetical protein
VGRKKREKNIENRETAVIDGCFDFRSPACLQAGISR